MKILIKLPVLFVLPFISLCICNGQGSSKIQWDRSASWSQVFEKASKENKFVFVDCYATWCGPCKKMDLTVFNQKEVGEYFDKYFISLKLQLDSTKFDDTSVISWYREADSVEKLLNISSLPTYLFFSPSGKLVNKFEGAFGDANSFLKASALSLDSGHQYYTLLDQFIEGKLDTSQMNRLFNKAVTLRDKNLCNKIIDSLFLHGMHLDNNGIERISSGTFKSNSLSFAFFLKNRRRINKQLGNYYADILLYRVLFNELKNKYGTKSKVISDWKPIVKELSILRGELKKGVELRLRMENMEYLKNWDQYSLYAIEYCRLFNNKRNRLVLNNLLWRVFETSFNKKVLKKAIKVGGKVLRSDNGMFDDPVMVDTYANLYYKHGNVDKAIYWEKKVIQIAKAKKNIEAENEFSQTLSKMEAGIPTWP